MEAAQSILKVLKYCYKGLYAFFNSLDIVHPRLQFGAHIFFWLLNHEYHLGISDEIHKTISKSLISCVTSIRTDHYLRISMYLAIYTEAYL